MLEVQDLVELDETAKKILVTFNDPHAIRIAALLHERCRFLVCVLLTLHALSLSILIVC